MIQMYSIEIKNVLLDNVIVVLCFNGYLYYFSTGICYKLMAKFYQKEGLCYLLRVVIFQSALKVGNISCFIIMSYLLFCYNLVKFLGGLKNLVKMGLTNT